MYRHIVHDGSAPLQEFLESIFRSPDYAIFSIVVRPSVFKYLGFIFSIFYLSVFIKKSIPGSIVYFVLFCYFWK